MKTALGPVIVISWRLGAGCCTYRFGESFTTNGTFYSGGDWRGMKDVLDTCCGIARGGRIGSECGGDLDSSD
jgi:hypothetical protein